MKCALGLGVAAALLSLCGSAMSDDLPDCPSRGVAEACQRTEEHGTPIAGLKLDHMHAQDQGVSKSDAKAASCFDIVNQDITVDGIVLAIQKGVNLHFTIIYFQTPSLDCNPVKIPAKFNDPNLAYCHVGTSIHVSGLLFSGDYTTWQDFSVKDSGLGLFNHNFSCQAGPYTSPNAPGPASISNPSTKPGFVLIDQRDPAFRIFKGVAKEASNEEIENIRSQISTEKKEVLVSWDDFTSSVGEYARAIVLTSQYIQFDALVRGIACLVESQPGASWGLTWNGGIALTYHDYQHVKETYHTYKTAPLTYKPIENPRADPVNPGGYLPAFGCM